MCTVTVVPFDDGLRVVCNRDERRTRTAAGFPRRYQIGSRWLTYPRDADGGGTWIGVNDAGLVLALVNRTRAGDSTGAASRRSRGLIVPPLLRHERLDEAERAAFGVDPGSYRPFTLVGIEGRELFVIASDGRALAAQRSRIDRPLLFTSSSLSDYLADAARRPLFERLVLQAPDSWIAGQQRFHAHRWPGRAAFSVVMSRPDARTVSRTVVDVRGRVVRMDYELVSEPTRAAEAASEWGVAC